MQYNIVLYNFIWLVINTRYSRENAINITEIWQNNTINMNSTSHGEIESHDKVTYGICSYKQLQYCHRYIKNILILYTRSGGWILLAITLCGIFFQILSHLIPRRSRNVALGIVQSTNIPLKLNVTQRLL